MNINNPQLFAESQWDWSILEGCFGDSRIMPSDIDGIAEKNGYFIYIEGKGPEVKIPEAQQWMQQALVNTGVFTVFNIWGVALTNEVKKIQIIGSDKELILDPSDTQSFRRCVSVWYKRAVAAPPAHRKTKDSAEFLVNTLGGKVEWL